MAENKRHDYHILEPSAWPLVTSLFALLSALGLVFWLHETWSALPFSIGMIGLIATVIAWWIDVTNEAEHEGHHTPVVQLHHRYGMALFIASEVMFFVAWFWAFLMPHFSQLNFHVS